MISDFTKDLLHLSIFLALLHSETVRQGSRRGAKFVGRGMEVTVGGVRTACKTLLQICDMVLQISVLNNEG